MRYTQMSADKRRRNYNTVVMNVKKIKRILRVMLPEEPKNWIPCVVFGTAMLVLAVANIIKWIIL